MKEKHAVVIVRRIVNGTERRIPLVGRLTGLRNPADDREIEFLAWTRTQEWRHCFIPQGAIVSMATFVSESKSEYKDMGSGI